MKRRRVKITGIGPVTPAGIGRLSFWNGMQEPVSRIRAFTDFDAEIGPFVAGYIDNFNVGDYITKPLPKGAARHTLFAIVAAALALEDAGLSAEILSDAECAIVTGSSLMDFEIIGRTVEGFISKGVRGALPRAVYTANSACIPATIADTLDLKARTMGVQSSCCSGLDAIGHAARLVSQGEANIAICGGTEAPLFRCPMVELRAAGLTPATTEAPEKIDRPFDLWRTTGVVSEGAAMFVIEPETSPRPAYAFIEGYAFAHDESNDLCGGMATSIKQALADARIGTKQIEAISAWGPGHRAIDAAEVTALKRVFGGRVREILANSIKGAVGNALGAAAAIQVAASALSLRTGLLLPTVNWEYPDPSCPLNLSSNVRAIPHTTTLINAHGLAGVNTSLILSR